MFCRNFVISKIGLLCGRFIHFADRFFRRGLCARIFLLGRRAQRRRFGIDRLAARVSGPRNARLSLMPAAFGSRAAHPASHQKTRREQDYEETRLLQHVYYDAERHL